MIACTRPYTTTIRAEHWGASTASNTVATETTWIETTVTEWIEVHGDPPKPSGESDAAEEPANKIPVAVAPSRLDRLGAARVDLRRADRGGGFTGRDNGRPKPAAVFHPRGGRCGIGRCEGF